MFTEDQIDRFSELLRERFLTHTKTLSSEQCHNAWGVYCVGADDALAVYTQIMVDKMRDDSIEQFIRNWAQASKGGAQ